MAGLVGAWVGLSVLLVLASLLPLSRRPQWWIRGLDFPRLQLAVLALLVLLAGFALHRWQPLGPAGWALQGLLLVCLAYQLSWVLPYTPFWRRQVPRSGSPGGPSLSLLSANVLMTNRCADALLALVRQQRPDLVITLESDHWWEQQLAPLETDYPWSVKCPLDNLYGMHLYSRLPLEETELCFLVEEDVPSIHTRVVLAGGESVRLHVLHPAPPSPSENEESTERDAELLVVARSLLESRQPVVVAGDLNDVAWSSTTRLFRRISGLLDPRIGRGMFNTFHVKFPFLRWPLDHLFHSRHFSLLSLRRLPDIGSDHFPLWVELALEPGRDDHEGPQEPSPGERQRAREITARGDVSVAEVPEPGRA